MKTKKQHKLEQERANLLEKNEQLKAELQVLIDKSIHDEDNYSFSDEERGEQIGSEIAFNARKIEAINRKLEMYEVIGDCYDEFYKRLKKDFDIKPNVNNQKDEQRKEGLPDWMYDDDDEPDKLTKAKNEEKERIIMEIMECNGDKLRAAKHLGYDINTFLQKIVEYNIH